MHIILCKKPLIDNRCLCRPYILLSTAAFTIQHWQEMTEKITCPWHLTCSFSVHYPKYWKSLDWDLFAIWLSFNVFSCDTYLHSIYGLKDIYGAGSSPHKPFLYLCQHVEISVSDHRLCVCTTVILAILLIRMCKEKLKPERSLQSRVPVIPKCRKQPAAENNSAHKPKQ